MEHKIYKCQVCGNVVELTIVGGGTLVCCGQPMGQQTPNTVDASQEKHVPVIEKTENGYKVKVGSEAHPMLAEHYIQMIEILADGKSYRKFLNPGEQPEAEFCIEATEVIAREYCNLHGLWKNK